MNQIRFAENMKFYSQLDTTVFVNVSMLVMEFLLPVLCDVDVV